MTSPASVVAHKREIAGLTGLKLAKAVSDGERQAVGPIYQAASEGKAYFVSEEMTQLAQSAAKTWPGQDLHQGDMPAPIGYLEYAVPIVESLKSEPNRGVVGFIWVSDDTGMYLSFLISLAPYDREQLPIPMPAIRERWHAGQLIPMGLDNPTLSGPSQLVGKAVLSTLTLMQQSLIEVEPQHLPRAEQRRCARDGVVKDLVIAQLRRVHRASNGTQTDVDWSHRWLVNGHWRNQWLASRKTHRLQWIPAHVKGPPDKPFLPKDHVTTWVR